MHLDFATRATRKRRRRGARLALLVGILAAAGSAANIAVPSRDNSSSDADGRAQGLASAGDRQSVSLAIPDPTNSSMALNAAQLPEDPAPRGSTGRPGEWAAEPVIGKTPSGSEAASSSKPHSSKTDDEPTSSGEKQTTATASPASPDTSHATETETETETESEVEQKDWQKLEVERGDSLAPLFREAGISAGTVQEVLSSHERAAGLRRLHPGDVIAFRTDDDGHLAALRYELSGGDTLRLRRRDGRFEAAVTEAETERRVLHASAVIRSSLFDAGSRVGLEDDLLLELASIFRWDIDFALDIRRGDAFTVIYEAFYRDGEKIRNGDILAAEFVNRHEAFRAVRYQHDGGDGSYYNPQGQAMRKAFLRSPVDFTRVSSDFDRNRLHPTLDKRQAHLGTDYAASRGTPIKATGDGRVVHRGRKGGYGHTVVLEHAGHYTTLYAHMASYANGLRHGDRVRQGDVIGYVGSSGRSTGPHLHYEFRVEGKHRDPQRVDLPTAESISDELRADFKEQTDELLTRLAMYSRMRLAAQGRLGP